MGSDLLIEIREEPWMSLRCPWQECRQRDIEFSQLLSPLRKSDRPVFIFHVKGGCFSEASDIGIFSFSAMGN
ncbi:MAG: hypothetical protein Q8K68_11135, partial [Nitrospirota bacterium]|nr:hypothetical protein [Nitrospirota bacterium]